MANLELYDAWNKDIDETGQTRAPDRCAGGDLIPGERIGQALPNHGRRTLRRAANALALAGGVWAAVATQADWQPLLMSAIDHLRAEMARTQAARPSIPGPAEADLPAPLAPLGSPAEIATVPGSGPSTPPDAPNPATRTQTAQEHAASPAVSPEPSGITTSSISPEPMAALPPPGPDPANPLEKRALAAGLHPRISSVVLASLTDADYRNATTAIDKALAETADADKFVWPREKSAKLAVFQVHFVPGTSEKCRRYVVTVVKNGWTTTAPPMEKCGIATPQRASGYTRKSARTNEDDAQPVTHAPTDGTLLQNVPQTRSPLSPINDRFG